MTSSSSCKITFLAIIQYYKLGREGEITSCRSSVLPGGRCMPETFTSWNLEIPCRKHLVFQHEIANWQLRNSNANRRQSFSLQPLLSASLGKVAPQLKLLFHPPHFRLALAKLNFLPFILVFIISASRCSQSICFFLFLCTLFMLLPPLCLTGAF